MDGLPPGVGSRSAHSSHHNSSHGRHRGGYMPNDSTALLPSSMPFMMPSYPMMVMPGGTQPSCAESGVLSPAYRQGVDRGRAPPSYGAENAYKSAAFAASAPRHSPSRSTVAASLPSSSDHRASASLQLRGSNDTYAVSAPSSQLSGRLAPAAEMTYPQYQEQPAPQKQAGPPEPPKKPLSPYMRFSKSIWFQVKAANPQLSVCQLGAMIGRMWRELTEEDKRRHLEDFHQDKVRYDNELKRYLKTTGLRAKDLKAIAKTQPKSKNRHRSRSSNSQQGAATAVQATTNAANSQLAAQAAFMGLPLGSMPMAAVGMPAGMLGHAGAMSMLPHFSQVWTGQQYAGQPASAAMMGIAGHIAQGLYSNGYMTPADGSVVGPSPSNGGSLSASKQAMLSHEMYRYSQNYH